MLQPTGRDRRGRGLRGRLVPPTVQIGAREVGVPLWLSRSDRFDELVRDVLAALEPRWADRLEGVRFAVEDVPPDGSAELEGVVADQTSGGPVPLGRLLRTPTPQILVYRRPLEARSVDRADLAELVQEVVLEQVADLLNVDRDDLDGP